METMVGIMAGVALAAACGFRVFVPLLVVCVAARTGQFTLSPSLSWMAGDTALVIFAVATAAEVAAYYLPWFDNLMDSLASPAAVVAGTLVTASFVTGMHPALQWTLAAILGGGAAAGTQMLTVTGRATSTVTTAGLANPILSTVEWLVAALLSLLAILAPVLAAVLVIGVVAMIARVVNRRRAHRQLQPA